MQVTHDTWNQVSDFYACRHIKNITRGCVFLLLLLFSHLLFTHTLVYLALKGSCPYSKYFSQCGLPIFCCCCLSCPDQGHLIASALWPRPFTASLRCTLWKAPSGLIQLHATCQPLHFGALGTIDSNPHQVQSPPLDIYKITEKLRFQWLPPAPGHPLTYTLFSLNSVGQLKPNLAPWLVSYAGFHCNPTHAKCFYEWTYLFYWRFAIVVMGQKHSSQYLLPILIAPFSPLESEFFLLLSHSNSQTCA